MVETSPKTQNSLSERVQAVGNLSLPDLPEEIIEQIRQVAEESSREVMQKIRPHLEKTLREALREKAASR